MPDPSDFRQYGFSTFEVFDAITKFMNTSGVRAELGVPAHVQFSGGAGICSSDVPDAMRQDTLNSSAADLSFILGHGIPVRDRDMTWISCVLC